MPQFDTSFLSSLIFWSLVSFGILVFLLYKYAFPVILETLENRERHIREGLEQAERARKEAEQLLADYQARLVGAQQEAHTILEPAWQRAQEAVEENEKRLERVTAKMLEEARREIEREREAATKEIRAHVVDLVLQAAAQLLQREVGDQDHRRLVEDTLQKIDPHPPIKKD